MKGSSFESAHEAFESIASGLLKQIEDLQIQINAHSAVMKYLIVALRKHEPEMAIDIDRLVEGWRADAPLQADSDKIFDELTKIGEAMQSIVTPHDMGRPDWQIITGGKE